MDEKQNKKAKAIEPLRTQRTQRNFYKREKSRRFSSLYDAAPTAHHRDEKPLTPGPVRTPFGFPIRKAREQSM
jgi:hypothetical protein